MMRRFGFLMALIGIITIKMICLDFSTGEKESTIMRCSLET